MYNDLDSATGVTWETSTIRSWLNGYDAETNLRGRDYTDDNFLDTAFSASEQAAIADSRVAVNDNTYVYPDNGNDTTDKVYLLSASEIMKTSYGFESTWNKTKTRLAKTTAYAYNSEGYSDWWTRTMAVIAPNPEKACYIDAEGRLWRSDGAWEVAQLSVKVRPALRLNLSTEDGTQNPVWSYAGKINTNGEEIEAELPTPAVPTESPAPSESPIPTESPAPSESSNPTESPAPTESPMPTESPVPTESVAPTNTPAATDTPVPTATTEAPKPAATTTAPWQSPQPSPSQSTPAPVKVRHITVSGKITKLAKGKKATLTPIVEPVNASNKDVVWSSSNPKVAVVDSNGIVTGKAAGKAVITATAADGSGVSGSYTIEVVKHAVKKIIIKAKKKVAAGKKVKVKVTIKTTGKTANKTLEWSTSNENYATITAKGVVKTKKEGKGKTITITAKATDGSGKKDTLKIKIK